MILTSRHSSCGTLAEHCALIAAHPSSKFGVCGQIRAWPMQGDMIPWTVGQQYQDPEFPLLSGARIVRIAAHPEMSRAGYGSRAMQLLRR